MRLTDQEKIILKLEAAQRAKASVVVAERGLREAQAAYQHAMGRALKTDNQLGEAVDAFLAQPPDAVVQTTAKILAFNSEVKDGVVVEADERDQQIVHDVVVVVVPTVPVGPTESQVDPAQPEGEVVNP